MPVVDHNTPFITAHLLKDQAKVLRNRAAVVRADAKYAMSKQARVVIGEAANDLLRQAQEKERQAAQMDQGSV